MIIMTSILAFKVGVLQASYKNSESKLRFCWNDASKFSSISSVSWLFVVFQDLTGRVVPPPAYPVSVQLCRHEATRHGDSPLSPTSFTVFSIKPASTVFPPNCHSNFQFGGVKKSLWESRSVFISDGRWRWWSTVNCLQSTSIFKQYWLIRIIHVRSKGSLKRAFIVDALLRGDYSFSVVV
jgi:hypothetical protein